MGSWLSVVGGWWVGETFVSESAVGCWWLLGWWNTCWWVGGGFAVVDGSVEHLSVDRCSSSRWRTCCLVGDQLQWSVICRWLVVLQYAFSMGTQILSPDFLEQGM